MGGWGGLWGVGSFLTTHDGRQWLVWHPAYGDSLLRAPWVRRVGACSRSGGARPPGKPSGEAVAARVRRGKAPARRRRTAATVMLFLTFTLLRGLTPLGPLAVLPPPEIRRPPLAGWPLSRGGVLARRGRAPLCQLRIQSTCRVGRLGPPIRIRALRRSAPHRRLAAEPRWRAGETRTRPALPVADPVDVQGWQTWATQPHPHPPEVSPHRRLAAEPRRRADETLTRPAPPVTDAVDVQGWQIWATRTYPCPPEVHAPLAVGR
jgi:hypothetical protein